MNCPTNWSVLTAINFLMNRDEVVMLGRGGKFKFGFDCYTLSFETSIQIKFNKHLIFFKTKIRLFRMLRSISDKNRMF